jgi:hypothetical protein
MNKQTVVYTENGVSLFSDRNKWAIKPWKDTKGTLMLIDMWKKPHWKGYILYHF